MSFQTYLVLGTNFVMDISRYKLIKPIGTGAYGFVCSAEDIRTGEKVAIKKIANPFNQATDTKRLLREIKLQSYFKHENVLCIRDIMRPPSKDQFKDVYLVSELMDTDLSQIIASDQPLSDDHFQYFLYQTLRGLKYIHSGRIIHRDLKPSNLLLNGNCDLKICDFGLSRVAMHDDPDLDLTEYVATRWYRAPEVMLSWKEYDQAIDIWSVGCIFAELLGRKPLFPGKDYLDQIHKIIDITGTPAAEDVEQVTQEKARKYLRSLPFKPKIPFARMYPQANPLALDLLEKMLTFNPKKRITMEQALAHPYLQTLHDPTDEPLIDTVAVDNFDFSFERGQLTPEAFKELVYAEMLKYHPELRDGVPQAHVAPAVAVPGDLHQQQAPGSPMLM
eukprot:TRINITY_DN1663_c0_g1_i2.p1 TRINITY_DN1663_c0_g1~~TRINITY_DN1663_c0_g1_i2.p1  ORF type:complete len:390 (+),score=74.59 TRINITY_DN1663_c0_g1_i2:132-1301(+)